MYWARQPLLAILVALQKRIEGGSKVKAWGVELDGLTAQPEQQQREKVAQEVAESLPAPEAEPATEAPAGAAPAPDTPSVPANADTTQQKPFNAAVVDLMEAVYGLDSRSAGARALQAEDLAMRALQTEYRQPIKRQVRSPSGAGFDGVFTSNGTVNVVEVKLVRGKPSADSLSKLSSDVFRVYSSLQDWGADTPTLIVALVFENMNMVDRVISVLSQSLPSHVIIRTFSFEELLARFAGHAGAEFQKWVSSTSQVAKGEPKPGL